MRQNHTKWQEEVFVPAPKKHFLVFSGILLISALGLIFFLSCSPKHTASGASAINGYVYQMFNSFDPRSFLENMGRNVIPPLYADLETQADDLSSQTTTFVGGCTGGNLSALQTSWLANTKAVKKIEMFRFGPALSAYAHIDAFPIEYLTETPPNPGDLDDLDNFILNSGASSLGPAQAFIGGIDRDAKGIGAIEYLLFSQSAPNRYTAPSCSDFSGARTYLLQALVIEYNAYVHSITDLWDIGGASPYGEQIATAGIGSTAFPTAASALDIILTGAVQLLTAMKDGKLEIPADLSGGGTGGSPDPDRPESRFSGNSFQNLQDNLAAFKAVYTGNGTGTGLADYVKFYSPTLDSEISTEITSLETVLVTATSTGGWGSSNLPNIKAAVKGVGTLLTILNTDLAALVGTTPVSGGPGGDGD